jgi:hypothetical protein
MTIFSDVKEANALEAIRAREAAGIKECVKHFAVAERSLSRIAAELSAVASDVAASSGYDPIEKAREMARYGDAIKDASSALVTVYERHAAVRTLAEAGGFDVEALCNIPGLNASVDNNVKALKAAS